MSNQWLIYGSLKSLEEILVNVCSICSVISYPEKNGYLEIGSCSDLLST